LAEGSEHTHITDGFLNGALLIEELSIVEGPSKASLRKILAALAGELWEHLPGASTAGPQGKDAPRA